MRRWQWAQRQQPSRFWSLASPLLALLLTVGLASLLFAALGKSPVQGLQVFFWEPIKNGYAWGELLLKATPLLLIGLGLSLCFRSNVWNIGAEGQFIVGAVAAGAVALLADAHSSRWMVLPVLLAGMAGGMVWGAVVAWLRDRFHANEILVSLMLVYVAEQFLGYMVSGPLKDPDGYGFPLSKLFEAATGLAWFKIAAQANLNKTTGGLHTGLLEFTELGLGDTLGLDRTPAELHSVIAVSLYGTDLNHWAGPSVDHRYGNNTPVGVEDLGHTQLGAENGFIGH